MGYAIGQCTGEPRQIGEVVQIAGRLDRCGLPGEVEIMVWPISGRWRGRVSAISRRYDLKL